mmetsp:Transcript_9920/g.14935  ORF Transcript_9920/g.14935 Transcript_9920/m.14935 type:complete len:85 (+) Transcript_9920:279-533(+)
MEPKSDMFEVFMIHKVHDRVIRAAVVHTCNSFNYISGLAYAHALPGDVALHPPQLNKRSLRSQFLSAGEYLFIVSLDLEYQQIC